MHNGARACLGMHLPVIRVSSFGVVHPMHGLAEAVANVVRIGLQLSDGRRRPFSACRSCIVLVAGPRIVDVLGHTLTPAPDRQK